MSDLKERDLNILTGVMAVPEHCNAPDEVYGLVLDVLRKDPGFDGATWYGQDGEHGERIILQRGDIPVTLGGGGESLFGENQFSGWMRGSRKPVVLSMSKRGQQGYSSFLSLPLWNGERYTGRLNLGHLQSGIYNRQQVNLYTLLGTQIAAVVSLVEQRFAVQETATFLRNEKNREFRRSLTDLLSHARVLPVMVEARNQRHLKKAAQRILEAARSIEDTLRTSGTE